MCRSPNYGQTMGHMQGRQRDDPPVRHPRSGCPIPKTRCPIRISRLRNWSRPTVSEEARSPERGYRRARPIRASDPGTPTPMRPAGAGAPGGRPTARRSTRERSGPNLAPGDGARGELKGNWDPEGLQNSQGWSSLPLNAGTRRRDRCRGQGVLRDTMTGAATTPAGPGPHPIDPGRGE